MFLNKQRMKSTTKTFKIPLCHIYFSLSLSPSLPPSFIFISFCILQPKKCSTPFNCTEQRNTCLTVIKLLCFLSHFCSCFIQGLMCLNGIYICEKEIKLVLKSLYLHFSFSLCFYTNMLFDNQFNYTVNYMCYEILL